MYGIPNLCVEFQSKVGNKTVVLVTRDFFLLPFTCMAILSNLWQCFLLRNIKTYFLFLPCLQNLNPHPKTTSLLWPSRSATLSVWHCSSVLECACWEILESHFSFCWVWLKQCMFSIVSCTVCCVITKWRQIILWAASSQKTTRRPLFNFESLALA